MNRLKYEQIAYQGFGKKLYDEDVVNLEQLRTRYLQSFKKHYHDSLGLPDWRERAKKRLEMSEAKNLFSNYIRQYDLHDKLILDMGSGWGDFLYQLNANRVNAYGVEPSPELGYLSRKRFLLNNMENKVIRAIGENLPFKENTFDFVFSHSVLEHVADPERCLEEMIRVLKPGGVCRLVVMNYLSFWDAHYKCFWFPFFPKRIARRYLKLRKRDPSFLMKHITYTNYISTTRYIRHLNVINKSSKKIFESPKTDSKWRQAIFEFVRIIKLAPLIYYYRIIKSCFAHGNSFELVKKESPGFLE